jgi:HSP20 family protein
MIDTLFYRPQGLFDQLANLQRTLSRSLSNDGAPGSIRSAATGNAPPVYVGRTATSIEVYAFAPGLDAASIDVTIERGVLRIAGERKPPAHANGPTQTYANERAHGRFVRVLSLPDEADTSQVQAHYRDGVLRVSVALQQAAQPQRIAVQ